MQLLYIANYNIAPADRDAMNPSKIDAVSTWFEFTTLTGGRYPVDVK